MVTVIKSKVNATREAISPGAGPQKPAKRGGAALSFVLGGRTAQSTTKPDGSPALARKPKRTLTSQNIVRTLVNALVAVPKVVKGLVKPDVSPALREKVILGVTSINDCRYCAWGHSHWAMAHGVSLEEVNQILGHQTDAMQASDAAEAAAILFAQHYAEHLDHFDPDAVENLLKHFSRTQVDEIIAYIHAITLGNLVGNTVDAFISRFRSNGHNSFLFEAAVTTLSAPIIGAVILAAKLDPEVKMDEMRVARAYGVDEAPK